MRDRKEIEAEKLANTIHDTFASAYALDEKVDPEWLKNVTKQALNQTAEKARVEERERFGKILSEIESSLKTSNGGKEEIEGIIWTAHEALKANAKN